MKAFEVIIGTSFEEDVPLAVASAIQKLVQGDHTEVAGLGSILDVDVYGGDGEQQIGVGIVIGYNFRTRGEIEEFLWNLEHISDVESFEEVAYEKLLN